MTQLDDRTDVLPPAPHAEHPEPARPRGGWRLVVIAGLVVVLLATLGAIAETVSRAEAERTVAEQVRNKLGIADSDRVQVDIAGSVLLQELVGRFESVGVTVYSFPAGRANADLTLIAAASRQIDGTWTEDRVSGALTLSAAQATALFLPTELQGRMRLGFSGGDVVIGTSVPVGTGAHTVSVAATPRFENGRLTSSPASVTIDDKTLSSEEVAALTGVDLSTMQPAPVCLAEVIPRALHLNDVRIADDRLQMIFDVDLPSAETAEGREPGSCP
ncbi:hypothetical protein [Microbacterium sp. SLBN-111]|uniref:hypothetical protein n=1 Tax=Microbacterium sp. SLBN-111 TaxID=3377733 RepID=UPI003C7912BF